MASTLILIGSSARTGATRDALALAEFLRKQGEELGICLLQDAAPMACGRVGTSRPEGATLYVLGEDLRLRGLRGSDVAPDATVVDYAELVDLMLAEYERAIGIF